MASTRRRTHSSLTEHLFNKPQEFELFQAMMLAERIVAHERLSSGLPAPEPLGHGVKSGEASLVVSSSVPLSFAAAEVRAIRRERGKDQIEMVQTVLGLTGPSGVLPHAISEMVQVSFRDRNPSLGKFFDIFNNRLASLLFNAWAKYRIGAERVRAYTVMTPTPIDLALKSIVGRSQSFAHEICHVPDSVFVYFGGLLGKQVRSSKAVERVLASGIGHDLRIEQFCGEWLPIAKADQTKLAGTANRQGQFAQLGDEIVIGKKIFDVESTIAIKLYIRDYVNFRFLLPGGERAKYFADLATSALGPDKKFRVHIELKADQVPKLRLGTDREHPRAGRLGWNTWLTMRKERTQNVHVKFSQQNP